MSKRSEKRLKNANFNPIKMYVFILRVVITGLMTLGFSSRNRLRAGLLICGCNTTLMMFLPWSGRTGWSRWLYE